MPRFHRLLIAALALAGSAAALAAPTNPLTPGTPSTFNLPGSAFTNSFYVDVPASSQRLTLQLTGGAGAGDIDLLLSSAAPFPDLVGGQPPSANDLFDAAQYRSASVEANEKLSISRANVFPVRAGRWYVSILNFATTPANPTLTATLSDAVPGPLAIEVVFNDATSSDPESPCRIAEWTDTAPRTPVAGNSGTTLGAQRQNAMREALRLISNEIRSDVPIRLQACWDDLGTGSTFTLAQAGPRTLLVGEPWMPRANTWFAIGPATKLGGATQCGLVGGSCTSYDIRATFNNQVDTAAIASDYFYGFAGPLPSGNSDFISVAMHEIAHGLGFISTVNTRAAEGPIGQRLRATNGVFYDDAFGHNLVGISAVDASVKRFMDMTDGERAAAITSTFLLRWDEPRAVNSVHNSFAGSVTPDNLIWMHTPSPVVPGSSLSHVGVRHNGELMRAQAAGIPRNLTLAGPMLEAVGWSTTPQSALTAPLPASNNLFDVRRDGHGIDFTRVRDNIYGLTFYTYGANGQPEWYQAVGTVTNGVFTAIADANGKSLLRYRYNAAALPPQTPVSAESGTVSLDFNNVASQAPCNDGRPNANAVAIMTFSLGTDQNVRWCMDAIVAATARPAINFSGLWFAGSADDGWGWSVLNFTVGATVSTYGLLFYYDALGNPVWSYALHNGVSANTATPIVHRRGYCRSCTATAFADTTAGTVTFGFTQPSESPAANNRVNYSSTPQNTVGGVFARTNSPFILLTTPQ